jgi:hypothetical protein
MMALTVLKEHRLGDIFLRTEGLQDLMMTWIWEMNKRTNSLGMRWMVVSFSQVGKTKE